jgi:hypothetical protein
MSIWAMTWAYSQRTGGPRVKAVLVAVANFVDPEGYGWPTIKDLCSMTEQSRSSVQRCLRALEELELLRREPTFDRSGRRINDGYFLLAPPEALRPPEKGTRARRAAPPAAPSGAVQTAELGTGQADTGGCQVDTTGGVSPDTGTCHGGPVPVSTVTPLSHPSSQPSSNDHNKRAPPEPEPDWWEQFWREYPHPKGDPTKLAHEAWLELIGAGIDPKDLVRAAKAYAAGKERLQFSVQAHRWLAQGRWSDWLDRARPSSAAPLAPEFASEIGSEQREWYRERCTRLIGLIGRTRWQSWIAKLTVTEIDAEVVRFTAISKFVADFVRGNFDADMQRVFGRRIEFRVSAVQQGVLHHDRRAASR